MTTNATGKSVGWRLVLPGIPKRRLGQVGLELLVGALAVIGAAGVCYAIVCVF